MSRIRAGSRNVMFYSRRKLVGNTVLTQQRWGFLFASTPTVAISFLLVFAVVAKAQDPFLACSPSEKFIQIKVTAISVPASGSAPQRLVWVLSEVSKPEDVRLTPADEILKSRIVEIFQMISDSHVQKAAQMPFWSSLPTFIVRQLLKRR